MQVKLRNSRTALHGLLKAIANRPVVPAVNSFYGGGQSCFGGLYIAGFKAFFYEYSNTYTTPRVFYSPMMLTRFFDMHGIRYNDNQMYYVGFLGQSHICCRHGKPEIVIRASLFELRRAVDGDEADIPANTMLTYGAR